jgi:AbiV family abortive infection protein
MSKRSPITVPCEKVAKGIGLCNQNALQLLDYANGIVQTTNGNNGIAFALWSFALEEFGKGLLLKERLKSLPEGKSEIDVTDFFTNHREKFEKGFDALNMESPTHSSTEVVVEQNTRTTSHTEYLIPGREGNSSVTISPGTVGTITDAVHNDPVDDSIWWKTDSVELRFAYLYVDWEKGQWRDPQTSLEVEGVVGHRVYFSESHLMAYIDRLRACVRGVVDSV